MGMLLSGEEESMSIILDHQLREQLHHISPEFLITYFHDEIIDLPAREGPVHWHPEFEIVTAQLCHDFLLDLCFDFRDEGSITIYRSFLLCQSIRAENAETKELLKTM